MYHLHGWKQINESEFGHETYYLMATADDEVCGILPLVLVRSRLFGRILCSLPFVNYCGPVADSSDVEQALLKSACEIADAKQADYLELRSLHECQGDFASSLDKVSLTIELAQNADELWNTFKSKQRTAIRRVYKSGIYTRSGGLEYLDEFFQLLSKSWRDLGTPIYRKKYFEAILRRFPENTRIYVAYLGGRPIATAFNGVYNGTVEGMWAGADSQYRHLHSNYVLYWEMIKDACDAGLQRFHLGRSSVDSGGDFFKRKWGADSKQLYWQYYLRTSDEIPGLNVRNPKFELAIRTWKKLPLLVTNLAGPFISRGIP
jgi:FemAB-related protein (PEP-CTERM system-associated)